MLIRMVRRHSILETDDPLTVLEGAFCDPDGEPELVASTYLLDESRLVQLRAEHCAGSGMDRPDKTGNIDLDGFVEELVSTNENKWFSFANEAHHDAHFGSRDNLLEVIRNLLADRDSRASSVSTSECKSYVKQKHGDGDAEWAKFFRDHPKGPRWLEKVAGVRPEE